MIKLFLLFRKWLNLVCRQMRLNTANKNNWNNSIAFNAIKKQTTMNNKVVMAENSVALDA